MINKKERPTTRYIELHCKECGLACGFYMTTDEILSNPKVEQWCNKCQKTTSFDKNKKGDNKNG